MKNIIFNTCLLLTALLGSVSVLFASNLPECNKSAEFWNNCFGTTFFEDGEKYIGEYKDNKYHGQGNYTYVDGSEYSGDFKDGKKNGQGTFKFGPNSDWAGDRYVGEFRDDKFHGQGAYIFSNGAKYVGEYRKNKYHGQGAFRYSDGANYVGEFKNGASNGQGTYTFGPNSDWAGDQYIGEFKDNKFDGRGTYLFVNGDKFVGEYRDNKKNGQGIFTFADGTKFVGEYRDGKRNGQFTVTYASGDKYVGEFKDGKKNGHGIFTFADGDKYVGEFKDGGSSGQGTYTFANGDKYVGEFKDDKTHGQGTYTFADGTKEIGEFKDGKLNGYAVRYDSDGSIQTEGIWKDNEFQYDKNLSPVDEPVSVIDYSLLIEEDGDSFMYISHLSDGTRVGSVAILGGYKWFEKTFNDLEKPQVYIQPVDVSIQGDLTSYTNEQYVVGEFNSKFVKNALGDQFLTFRSRAAIAQINSYLSKNENFSIAGLTKDSWYAGIFDPVEGVNDLIDLAKNYPDGFCFLLDLPIISTAANRQLKVKNITRLMENNAIKCDDHNNVVFEDTKKLSLITSEVDSSSRDDTVLPASDLPSCPGSPTNNKTILATWTDCFGETSLGDIEYVGEWKNGYPDGIGTAQYENGKYLGQWKSGRAKHGQGTYYFANGEKYVGEFKDDKQHGQGTYIFADGEKYVGEFTDSKKNGHGTYTYLNGDRYVGEWEDDQRHGQGIFIFGLNSDAAGDKYAGEYKNNQYHGQGTYTYANGDQYVGEFKDGMSNGQGSLTFGPNSDWAGDKYVGEHRNNDFNGQGTYIWANGDKYVGEFQNGKFNGKGIKTFTDGTVEEGIWKDDEFQYALENASSNSDETFSSTLPSCPSDTSVRWHDCFGTYTLENGAEYVGEFKDDDKNGQGTYTWADGDKYVGEYRNGKRNGLGTFTYADGDKYVGEYRNGEKNGQGTYTWADGVTDVGTFSDGKLNGFATRYSASGKILKEGIWKDDEFQYAQNNPSSKSEDTSSSPLPSCPSDRSVRWHNCFGAYTFDPDSDWAGDKYVGEWKDDEKNGQGTYTWANGDKYVGEYRNGEKNGQGTYTSADGDKYVGEYRNSEKNGLGTVTYASGDTYVGEFKDDDKNGQGTYTWADGDKYVGEFKGGKFNGRGTSTWGPKSEWAGDKYVGDFKDDKKQGQGTYTWANGDKYVGEFKDDASNGQGTYTFADGSVMEGIWKDWEFQYAQKKPSPVPEVQTSTQDEEVIPASSGSGFAVSPDGYVITNHHVIDGCEKVVVQIKGKELPVTVVTYDPQNDLALLKGDFSPSTVFPLSSNRPELLQDIYVAGFPFGDMFSTSVKVTKGIISSLTGLGNNFSNFQIDAALQSGNSGGPILDDLGNVVGVAVAKLDAKYMLEELGIIPEDTNFGIKSNVVRSILESNDVESPSANQSEISKSKLGKMISTGTFYISCWMTTAQIENMKSKKIFFNDLN